MGFQVPPTRVSRRSSLPVFAGVAVTAGLLLGAVLLAGGRPGGPPASQMVPATAAVALPYGAGPATPGPVAVIASAGRKAAARAQPGPGGPASESGPGGEASPPATGRATVTPGIRKSMVRCHDLGAAECLSVARAAAGLLVADAATVAVPAVAHVDVWRSLVCGDNLQCPPATLVRLDPLGSAALVLAGDAGSVWVNVGELTAGPDEAAARRPVQAWIVRWFH